MPRTIVVETFEEFCEANEQDGRKVWVDPYWIFQTGARVTADGQSRWNPPTSQTEKRKWVRHYLRAMIAEEEKLFLAFKNKCLEQASLARNNPDVPGPPGNAAQQLAKGKARIEKLRQQLEEIESVVRADPQSEQATQKARAEALAVRRQEVDELAANIEAVEI